VKGGERRSIKPVINSRRRLLLGVIGSKEGERGKKVKKGQDRGGIFGGVSIGRRTKPVKNGNGH